MWRMREEDRRKDRERTAALFAFYHLNTPQNFAPNDFHFTNLNHGDSHHLHISLPVMEGDRGSHLPPIAKGVHTLLKTKLGGGEQEGTQPCSPMMPLSLLSSVDVGLVTAP